MKLEDLKPDPNNANRGTTRGDAMLEKSLSSLGAGRSIVVDKNGNVIAGNRTLQKAAEMGLRVEPVHTRGERLVVVVRDDLDIDSEEARQLALADNRANEVGLSWDAGQLVQALKDGVDIDWLFTPDELEEIVELELDEKDDTESHFFSVILDPTQAKIVERAFKRAGGSQANALTRICEEYLGQ